MLDGAAYSNDLRRTLIYMHIQHSLDAKSISHYTGVPSRSVYRILADWRRTGQDKLEPTGRRGRPRKLDFSDTQVSYFLPPYPIIA